MSPIFAIVAWPLVRMFGAKLLLWYLHRSRTLKLRLALAMCDNLVTADADSLTVQGAKIISVGHGIDTERFSVPDRQPIQGRLLRILSVGRLSPIKNFETLIRAVEKLKKHGKDIQARIVGRAVMPGDKAYEDKLRLMTTDLGLDDVIEFIGFVPYREVSEQYSWADIIVGCTPHGGLDKSILEGMASGCIPLTSNDAMRSSLGSHSDMLVFRYGDVDDLAGKIELLPPDDMGSYAADMRDEIIKNHNLPATVEKLTRLL
jgi:glycosyltransferase involved in cell wall biosynthesis